MAGPVTQLCISTLCVYVYHFAEKQPADSNMLTGFFRDMALGGPYFSLFLLNVIFAHACRHMPDDDPRFAPYERGEFFLKKALLLLLDEIKESKPKIPTIQGLLILGGRQCAVGKSSEGWLYTGMVYHPTPTLYAAMTFMLEELTIFIGNQNDHRSWPTFAERKDCYDEGIRA